jgi:hypothetical protein
MTRYGNHFDRFRQDGGEFIIWIPISVSVIDKYLLMVSKEDYSTCEATPEVEDADNDLLLRLSRDVGVDPADHKMIKDVLSKALDQGLGDQAIPAICEVLSPDPDATRPTAGI